LNLESPKKFVLEYKDAISEIATIHQIKKFDYC